MRRSVKLTALVALFGVAMNIPDLSAPAFDGLTPAFGVKPYFKFITPEALGVTAFFTQTSTACCVDVNAPSLPSMKSWSYCYALKTSAKSGLMSSS